MTGGDLHLHTTHSDSSASVSKVLAYAASAGLAAVAITDHDTMAGVAEAEHLGKKLGIRVIPGVELTTRDTLRDRPVHLLCYLPENQEYLQGFCKKTRASRTRQKIGMLALLKAKYPIRPEDVFENALGSGTIYECHIMKTLADMGYTSTVIGPLMGELISRTGSCYVPSDYPDVMKGLSVIHEAGGLAVVAHPGQFESMELVESLAKTGAIDGVEVNHPRNTEAVRKRLRTIAEEWGLLITGGSDFHGSYAMEPHPVGYCACEDEDVKRLIARADAAHSS